MGVKNVTNGRTNGPTDGQGVSRSRIMFTNCQLLSIIKRIIDEFGYSWHHWAYKRYGCITGDNAGFFHIDGEI